MKKRKLCSVLLAVIMSVTLSVPTFATEQPAEPGQTETEESKWTAEDFSYSEDGTAITGLSESGTEKIAENPDVVMPNTSPDGTVITAIADAEAASGGMFGKDAKAKSVVLPEQLETIGSNVFRDCGLENISFPDTLKTIGNFVFMMDNLTEVMLPDSVESVGTAAFASNFLLQKVRISKNMTVIPMTFVGCTGVKAAENFTEIEIPEGITEIGNNAFAGNGFTRIEIPKSVSKIGTSSFAQVQAYKTLEEIVLHEGLTSIGSNAFQYASAKEVRIPSTVTDINTKAFNGCDIKVYTYDKSLETSHFSSGVTEVICILTDEIEKVDSALKELDEDDYFKESWQNVADALEAARTIDADGEASREQVKAAADTLEEAWNGLAAKSISEVTVSPEKLTSDGGEVKVTVSGNLEGKIWYVLQKQEADESYTVVGEARNEADTEFTLQIPENTEKRDVTYTLKVKVSEPLPNAQDGSYDWEGAGTKEASFVVAAYEEPAAPGREWTAEDFTYSEDGTAITGLSESGLARLTVNADVVMPDTSTKDVPVTAIADAEAEAGGMFGKGAQVKSVVLPGKLETIGDNVFRDCGLETIDFPDTLKAIGNSAFIQDKLSEIILPDSVERVGNGAFGSNFQLQRVRISKNLTVIPAAFVGCSGTTPAEKFTEIEIPEGVTEIGNNAFAGNCFAKVEVPKSVTKIGDYAFSQVNAYRRLEEIVLHEGLQTIGKYAFRHVPAKEIRIPSTVTSLNSFAFDGCEVKVYTYDKELKASYFDSGVTEVVCVLTEGIEKADSIMKELNADDYTEESWKKAEDALAEAQKVYADSEATAEQIKEAADRLQDALDSLTKKDPSKEPEKDPSEDSDKTSGNNPETKPVVKVNSIKLKAVSNKVAAGKKIKMSVTVSPKNAANKSVTWTSSNTKYATVSKSGKVTFKKAGAGKNVTITAKASDGSGKKASFKFKIMKDSVKSIQLKAKTTVKAGKKLTVKATVKTTGKNANKKLSWTSSNTKYATVSSKGVVKTKKAGKGKKVTITASSTDGSNKKKSVKIKIK